MIKATCNLLIFDKVDVNGNLFPKDMEIDIPEKVPLLSSTGTITNQSDVIGFTSARRNENRLEADVIFYDGSEEFENGLKELIQDRKLYIAGYYTAVKYHEKDGIRVIDSMRLTSTFLTYADVYGDDDLLIRMEDPTEQSEDRPSCRR